MGKVIVPYDENLNFKNAYSTEIQYYKWVDNNYRPKVEMFLCHNNKSLKIKFIAFESKTYTKAFEDDGRIWCDSCVEFFVKPDTEDDRYINFEVNPAGAMVMQIGLDRNDRTSLVKEYKTKLNVKTDTQNNFWSIELEIPFSMISKIFKNEALKSGDILYGNFYKCGVETPFPHYGMWNEIKEEIPDFHQSKYFGEIILE